VKLFNTRRKSPLKTQGQNRISFMPRDAAKRLPRLHFNFASIRVHSRLNELWTKMTGWLFTFIGHGRLILLDKTLSDDSLGVLGTV
jgi:hypothetical protein